MYDSGDVIWENVLIPRKCMVKYLGVKSVGYFIMVQMHYSTILKRVEANLEKC